VISYLRASAGAVVAELEAIGYCIIEGVLSADELARKRRELDPLLAATETGSNSFLGGQTRRIYTLLAKVRCFDDAVLNPLLLAVMDRLLIHYQLCVATAIEIGPGETAQTLHADDGVYPLPNLGTPLTVNSMWALDDFTEENGATRLVPGSHRGTEKKRASPGATVTACMPAGSVLLYYGSLLHGGGANCTHLPRLGVVIEYAVSWIRPQENLGLCYPPSVAAGLPRRLQELMGYNLYPPFLGYVDGKHPLELLGEAPDPP
jgi:ectoine hydroxylase-related dioxygenase (phytanoyl-CoA dioxygenase family)